MDTFLSALLLRSKNPSQAPSGEMNGELTWVPSPGSVVADSWSKGRTNETGQARMFSAW